MANKNLKVDPEKIDFKKPPVCTKRVNHFIENSFLYTLIKFEVKRADPFKKHHFQLEPFTYAC